MIDRNQLLVTLQKKSNLDYEYFHVFNDIRLNLSNTSRYEKKHYILYHLQSQFTSFHAFYQGHYRESITDVFIERCSFSQAEKHIFFSMIFRHLFWIRLNRFAIPYEDIEPLVAFLNINSSDVNRIFLEQCSLDEQFFMALSRDGSRFENLSFINVDNNHIGDVGILSLIDFLHKRAIHLEYLSLVNNGIGENGMSQLFRYYISERSSMLRILDISGNTIGNSENVFLDFLKASISLQEIYMKNIVLNDALLDELIRFMQNKEHQISIVHLSLSQSQSHYWDMLEKLGDIMHVTIDIDIINPNNGNDVIYTTIYMKEVPGKEIGAFKSLENEYFYIIDSQDQEHSYEKIFSMDNKYMQNGINLFLFDISNYEKIFYILTHYSFNYIYLENYHISDEDFIAFVDTIYSLKNKRYKINLISIPLNEFQLSYLIDHMPSNITYIELNLNKIVHNRELYIAKMCRNPAFIFENMELYKKLF